MNGENQELLHFGAYNAANEEVLKKGANHYIQVFPTEGIPDEEKIPIYDNSHGTTIINSNLTVEKSSANSAGALLSIDGILKNGQNSQKSITNSTSVNNNNKLIITGFMEGVKIKGYNIVTDNMHIYSKNENVPGEFEFIGGASKAYGTIYLHKGCKLTVKDGGILTMETSSAVYFYNDSEIIIGDGGEIIIDYSTVIRNPLNGNGKITVKPGGKLTIKEGGLTHIDVPIILESESETNFGILKLGTDNLTHLYEVKLQGYSQLIMNNKSNLHIKTDIIANGNSTIKMLGQSNIRHYNYHPAKSYVKSVEKITLNDESSLIVDNSGLAYIDVPIIVNSTSSSNDIGVLFKNNSTTFIQNMQLEGSGKSKLFIGSKVHVKDSIVIKDEHASLTFENNSAVLHYDMNDFTVDGLWKPLGIYINNKFVYNKYHTVMPANGMIIVGSGARLEVPSTTVSLLSGVYVRENGTLTVGSDSDLKLGQFVNVGTFNINKGSEITLFCNSNFVFNNLHFNEGSSQKRTLLKGFRGTFEFFPTEKEDKVIVCIPRIFVTDFNAEDETEGNRKFYRADLDVREVNFNTVFWQISKGDNVEFRDCQFQIDSKELFLESSYYYTEGGISKHKHAVAVPAFINVSKNRVSVWFDNHPLKKHNLKNVSIVGCEFQETGYDEIVDDYTYGSYHFQPERTDFVDSLVYYSDETNKTPEEKKFRRIPNAVHIGNAMGITNVQNNTFNKVRVAIWCADVRDLQENSNIIQNSYKGSKLHATPYLSCDNHISNTKYAYETDFAISFSYKNTISNCLVGYRILGSSAHLQHNNINGAKFGTHILKGGNATIGKEKYSDGGQKVKSGNIFNFQVTNSPSPKLHYEKIKFEYKDSQGNPLDGELVNSSNIVFENHLSLRCGYNSLRNRIEITPEEETVKHFHIFNASMYNVVLDVNKNLPIKVENNQETNVYLIDDRITLGPNQTHEHHYNVVNCNYNAYHDDCIPVCPDCEVHINHDNWHSKNFDWMLASIMIPPLDPVCHQCEILNAYYYSQFHPNSDSLYPYLIPALDSALRIEILEPDSKIMLANLLFRIYKHLKLPADANFYLDYLLEHLSSNQIDSMIVELERLKLRIDFEVDPHSQEYLELLDNYKSASFYHKSDSAGGGGINPKFALGQNQEVAEELSIYPNPFEETTTISFTLNEDAYIELKIYDVLGNEVMQMEKGMIKKGMKEYSLDGQFLSSGAYFVVLKKHSKVLSRKLLYLK